MGGHIPAGAILLIMAVAFLIAITIDYWENHIAPRQSKDDPID